MSKSELIITKEVTKLFGLSIDAVRKYKDMGLIKPSKRVGRKDLWDKQHIIRMKDVIHSGKQKDKTLQLLVAH